MDENISIFYVIILSMILLFVVSSTLTHYNKVNNTLYYIVLLFTEQTCFKIKASLRYIEVTIITRKSEPHNDSPSHCFTVPSSLLIHDVFFINDNALVVSKTTGMLDII